MTSVEKISSFAKSRVIRGFAVLAVVTSILTAPATLLAEDKKPNAKAKITYEEHIRPIFRQHCFSCHNVNKAKGALALDTFAKTLEGGSSGEVVYAGELADSRLWSLVNHEESPKMPPEQDKLPEAKLTLIRQWIEGGALENSGSKAVVRKKPSHDLVLKPNAGKPEGPPPMPEKLWRQPVVYTPRAAAVTAIATSPWAPLAAVAGQRQIALYNTDNARLVGVLPFADGVAQVLRFSRSGALLIAGGGHSAQLGVVAVYDVKSGRRIITLGEELDAVLAADIDATQSMVALAGPQRMIRVYSTSDGSLMYEIKKHTEWVYDLEFSPDGVLLATADRNGAVHLWEAETGRPYMTLTGHKSAVHAVSWRADSNVVATASEDGTVKLWEVKDGKSIRTLNAGGAVTAVQFARDGRLVTTSRNKQTRLWKTDGNAERTFEALPDIGLEVGVSHSAAQVIAGDWSGKVYMWNAADGRRLAELPPNPPTLAMLVDEMKVAAATANAARDKAKAHAAALDGQVKAKATALEAARGAFAAMTAQQAKAKSDLAAADKQIAAAKQEATKANGQITSTNTEIAKHQAALTAANKTVAQRKAAHEAAEKAVAEKQQLVAKLMADVSQVEKQLTGALMPAATTKQKAASDVRNLADQAEGERKTLADLLAKTPAKEKPAIEAQLVAKTAAATTLKQKADAAIKEAEAAKNQVAAMTKKIADNKKAGDAAKAEHAKLTTAVTQAQTQLTAATAAVASTQKTLADAQKQLDLHKQGQVAANNKKTAAERQRATAQQAMTASAAKLPALKKSVDDLTTQKSELDKQLAASQAALATAEKAAQDAAAGAKTAADEKAAFERLPAELAAAVAATKTKADAARKSAEQAMAAKSAAEQALAAASAPRKDIETKIAALRAELEKLEAQLKPHQQKVAEQGKTANAATQAAATAEAALRDAEAKQKQFAEVYGGK
ncbi:MAG: hypothetical protein MI757_01885 [Pirellulales bacterium]|nr:hypothetical protein [Pirellulales bacterium]